MLALYHVCTCVDLAQGTASANQCINRTHSLVNIAMGTYVNNKAVVDTLIRLK